MGRCRSLLEGRRVLPARNQRLLRCRIHNSVPFQNTSRDTVMLSHLMGPKSVPAPKPTLSMSASGPSRPLGVWP